MKNILALMLAAMLLLLTPVLAAGETAPEEVLAMEEEAPQEEMVPEEPVYSTASDYVIGNTVVFGHYEQDKDTENGQEPIEWLVLDTDKEGCRALVISCLCLDVKQVPHPGRTRSLG
jgi:hypothetical protein